MKFFKNLAVIFFIIFSFFVIGCSKNISGINYSGSEEKMVETEVSTEDSLSIEEPSIEIDTVANFIIKGEFKPRQ